MELDTALFRDQSDQVLRCPTSLIRVFDFDLHGNIYFFIERPYLDINGMREQFPAQLHFHKKGIQWSIDLCGTASVDCSANVASNKVLIKFRTLQAKCFYARKHHSSAISNLWQHVGYLIKKLYQDAPDCLEMALE